MNGNTTVAAAMRQASDQEARRNAFSLATSLLKKKRDQMGNANPPRKRRRGGKQKGGAGKYDVLIPAAKYTTESKAYPESPPSDDEQSQSDAAWQRKFFELVVFMSKNDGCTIIPHGDDNTPEMESLWAWVMHQRKLYKKYNRGDITLNNIQADRMAALKQIGFVFEARVSRPGTKNNKRSKGASANAASGANKKDPKNTDADWQARYEELIQHMNDNNNDTADTLGTQTDLGRWLNLQRTAYKEYQSLLQHYAEKYPRHRTLLPEEMPRRERQSQPKEEGLLHVITQDRIDRLSALPGFQWTVVRKSTTFENRLAEYARFREEHGHGFVPQKYRDDPSLGKWTCRMRYDYKKFQQGEQSSLTLDKIRRLEEVGFEFVNVCKADRGNRTEGG